MDISISNMNHSLLISRRDRNTNTGPTCSTYPHLGPVDIRSPHVLPNYPARPEMIQSFLSATSSTCKVRVLSTSAVSPAFLSAFVTAACTAMATSIWKNGRFNPCTAASFSLDVCSPTLSSTDCSDTSREISSSSAASTSTEREVRSFRLPEPELTSDPDPPLRSIVSATPKMGFHIPGVPMVSEVG